MNAVDRVLSAKEFSVVRDNVVVGRGMLVFLPEKDSRISALVHDIFVDERYRRQGIAREMVMGMLSLVRTFGCYKVILTVRESNRAARNLYESLGFKKHSDLYRKELS